MTGAGNDPSTGRLLGGRYQLSGIVARGGTAEVWTADDLVLERRVAVKILQANLTADETVRARFRREARAAAQMAHPNIVAVYDTGGDDEAVYIVMEYVSGDTLRRLLDTQGALRVDRAIEIAACVADALDEAHRRGLVHRDIKPANVLVDTDGVAKVTDFGIAKVADAAGDLTRSGVVVGTARYLAPEQVSGTTTDARTDVYALALVLYEMLTGEPAFDGDDELSSAIARVTSDPPPLLERRPDLDPEVARVVERGFARDPGDRWESAARFRDALRAALGEAREPVTGATAGRTSRSDPHIGTGNGERDPASTAHRVDDPVPVAVPAEHPATAEVALDAAVVPEGRSGRPWLVPVLLGLLGIVAGAGVLVATMVFTTGEGDSASLSIPIAEARDFDPPPGDGSENPETAGGAIDGDPTTGWTTQTYATPDLGGLKDGVGLRLDLADPHSIGAVTVLTDQEGWSGAIYVTDDPGETLASWGPPRAEASGLSTSARFELSDDPTGGSVLVWITRLPDRGQLVVHGVELTG